MENPDNNEMLISLDTQEEKSNPPQKGAAVQEETLELFSDDIGENAPNIHGNVPFKAASFEELDALLTAEQKRLGVKQFIELVRQPGTYQNLLFFAVNDPSVEAERTRSYINDPANKLRLTGTISNDKVSLGIVSAKNKVESRDTPENLSGDKAYLQMYSALNPTSFKRIPLFNSGFAIDIKAPTLDIMNLVVQVASVDSEEFGHEFGAHYYAFNHMFIARAVFDVLIPHIVIGSNLHNWRRTDVLRSHISMHDFDVILMASASMFYSNGYEDFTHHCVSPVDADGNKCNHVEKVSVTDLTSFIVHDQSRMSEDAILHMARYRDSGSKPISSEEVDKYKAMLIGDVGIFKYNRLGLKFCIPTIDDYSRAAAQFDKDLKSEMILDNVSDPSTVIAFRQSRAFIPFIKSAIIYDNDGKESAIVSDTNAIAKLIDDLMSGEYRDKFIVDIRTAIDKTKISHIVYPSFPCPSCGHVPSNSFFSIDPLSAFFTLCVQRLVRA